MTEKLAQKSRLQLSKIYMVGQKIRLFLRVDNFAMVNGRKVCAISKVFKFCIGKKLLKPALQRISPFFAKFA